MRVTAPSAVRTRGATPSVTGDSEAGGAAGKVWPAPGWAGFGAGGSAGKPGAAGGMAGETGTAALGATAGVFVPGALVTGAEVGAGTVTALGSGIAPGVAGAVGDTPPGMINPVGPGTASPAVCAWAPPVRKKLNMMSGKRKFLVYHF